MNIEYFIIETFSFIDDELKKITSQVKLRSRGYKPALADSEVISMEIIGEFMQIDTDKGLWTYFSTSWKHFFSQTF